MTDIQASDSYRVALPEFEGPLDLLLHLCKTHEIEIVNIPIAFITEKYLEFLDAMQDLPVDVAAEYLLMAATLAYLKSRELVPAPEPLEVAEEEGEESTLDPREELIRRLLEYQKYKNAAAQLGERPIEGRNIFGRGMEVEGDGGPAPLADHSVWKLIEAFGRLLEKAGPKVTHEVLFDRISISARINQMIDKLEAKDGAFRFDELFDLTLPEAELRSQLVVTLLAILELARLKVIRVLASDDAQTLFIAQVEGAALQEARRAKASSDAESARAIEEDAEDGARDGAVPSAGPPSAREAPAQPAAVASAASGEAPSRPTASPFEDEPLSEDESPLEDEAVLDSLLEDESLPESEPSPEDESFPENEPLPEDESFPENEPAPQDGPAPEDEHIPGGQVIPPGEPVSEGDVISGGDSVFEGEVIPPGEVVSTAGTAPGGASDTASVSSIEETHEEA